MIRATGARASCAFTLVEVIVAASVVTVIGGVAFLIMNSGLVLFAKNYGLNQTHHDGIHGAERILTLLQSAVEAPQLVDNTGAAVVGNGPSAGVRFKRLASALLYEVEHDVNATDVSLKLKKTTSNQPAPKVGDIVQINDLGFKAEVISTSGGGGTITVNLASTVGSYFTTPISSGTAIPKKSRAFLVNQSALISVGSELRLYSDAKHAQKGQDQTAFNNSAHFSVLTRLTPTTAGSESLPFQYTDTSRRLVDVTLRVQSSDYSNRKFNSMNTYLNMRTSVAYRSAAL
jgi:hypothetical protein